MSQDLRQYAVERILEDETLTTDLVDQAAKILLDWGVAQAQTLPQSSQREVEVHLSGLRYTMKRINELVGEAPPDTQVERVQALLDRINCNRGGNET